MLSIFRMSSVRGTVSNALLRYAGVSNNSVQDEVLISPFDRDKIKLCDNLAYQKDYKPKHNEYSLSKRTYERRTTSLPTRSDICYTKRFLADVKKFSFNLPVTRKI